MKNLKELLQNVDMVLLNEIVEVDPFLIDNVELGTIEEDDGILQYYVTNNKSFFEWLFKNYEVEDLLVVFYSEKLDCFVVWMKVLDNWENVKVKSK